MSTSLESCRKRILWINQTVWKMWLWTWTQIKLTILELLLVVADFAKLLAMEDFKHCELHKAVERKYD